MSAEITAYQCMVMLRATGASLRSIARAFGLSKSTLHRQWPAIVLLAEHGSADAVLSHMGRGPDDPARHSRTDAADMSHMGRGGAA